MKYPLALTILTSTVLLSAPAFADHPGQRDSRWEFGVGVGTVGLDSEIAAEEFIDDSAWAFSLFANYLKADWIGTLALDFVNYDDDAGFSQRVTSTFGGDSTEDSSASGIVLTGAYGKTWLFYDDKTTTYLQGGYSFMASSSRDIPNCSNCFSDDIDIDGGALIRAGVNQNLEKFGLGLEYTQYVTGDIENSVVLTVTTPF